GSERWPTPEDVIRGSQEAQANILHKARCDLVRKYRENPAPWPDGITHKHSSDQWYKPEDWNDQGQWIAPHKPPWLIIDPKFICSDPEQIKTQPTAKPSPQQVAAAIKTILPKTDSPQTDSPDSVIRLSLASSQPSIRDIARALNISIGKVQRTLAKA